MTGPARPPGAPSSGAADDVGVVVPGELDGARADRVVAALLDLSTGAARRLLEAGRVRVDRRKVKKGDALAAGAAVVVEGHGAWLVPGPDVVPRLRVDDRVVVVDKPAGMPCHPLVPGEGGTVVDALVALFPEIAAASEDPREGGLVHRLDTGTSGCLALARDRGTWRSLRAAFAGDGVDKSYLALVHGVARAALTTDAPLAHDPRDPRRMRVDVQDARARPAHTAATPLAHGPAHTLLEVRMRGGRRHRIRVHLAAAGHALVGDALYGAPVEEGVPWHLLHAWTLALPERSPVRARIPPAFAQAAAERGLVLPEGVI